jgi:hypothetical protein
VIGGAAAGPVWATAPGRVIGNAAAAVVWVTAETLFLGTLVNLGDDGDIRCRLRRQEHQCPRKPRLKVNKK